MKNKLLAFILALGILLCGCEIAVVPTTQPSLSGGSEGTLSVHYIDVGQADAILLETEGKFMLIDGGNKDDSQLVVSYLEQQGVSELEAVVCTHPHEDHVGGLPAVLAVYPTKAVYAPTKTYSSKIFDSFLYYVDQQGLDVTIPSPGQLLTFGDMIMTFVGPVQSYAETNDTSIVISAFFDDVRFIFTGDMEVAAENDMLDYWGEQMDWDSTVLKVGHHGSSTSSSYRFIREIDPEYAIVSVGKDNSYGHPHKEVISRYADAGIPMLRTDELGHIIVTADGSDVQITWQNQSAQPDDVEPADTTYIGNKNSKKLHTTDCDNLPSEQNRVEFHDYNEAIDAGYTPCGNCMK